MSTITDVAVKANTDIHNSASVNPNLAIIAGAASNATYKDFNTQR